MRRLVVAIAGWSLLAGTVVDLSAHEMKMDRVEVPAEYRGKENPYWTDLDAIVRGSAIYNLKCAGCHGREGRGDGPAAKDLDPRPADFTDKAMMADARDDYLLWRVMEGGAFPPFNSAMPSFKGILTEKEAWEVLAYIHAFSHRNLLDHRPGEVIPEKLPTRGGGH